MLDAHVRSLFRLSKAFSALAIASGPALAGGGPPAPAAPLHGYLCDGAVVPILPDPYSGLHGALEGSAHTGSTGAFPGPGNEALLLAGASDRVLLSASSILAHRPSSSVSAWFFAFAGGMSQYPIYGERDACDFNVYWVGIERRPGLTPGLTFAIFEEGPACGVGVWHTLASGIEPAPGMWHHVAAVLDGTSGMRLYLDGVLVAGNPSTAHYTGVGSGASTIGHAHVPSHDGYWPGALDDIALFPFALTPPEVAWLATHGLSDLPPRSYATFCTGDGSGTACPCGNDTLPSWPAGCRNSTGAGGALRGYGNASVSAETFTLSASDVPTTTTGIFIQGTDMQNGGAGISFGDGLLCVGGSVLRIATVSASGGFAYYPHPGNTPISVRGAIPPAGATRHYQFWYRNAANFCTSATFNYSNGVSVDWTM